MRKLYYILQKEFRQLKRDKMIVVIMLAVPILQLLILPWAADMDVRHVKIAVVDNDQSSCARQLISKITSSGNFELASYTFSYQQATQDIEEDNADIILTIPPHFERNLIRENKQQVSITANAINGIKAGLGTAYLNSIIRDFNMQIRVEWLPEAALDKNLPIQTTSSALFNPHANYRFYMVPAILVLLLTVVGAFLTSLNIVKEKEIGTIEQINVTPIKKWEFILGKLIPFWIISLFVFSLGLLITRFVYGIPIVGNIGTLYLFTNLYIIGILGFGLLISNFSQTQQQSMFISFFFVMIFILMSGLFTSTASMPAWAKVISNGVPITHYMKAVRALVLKGSSFMDLWQLAVYLVIFALVLNMLAILSYKKTS